MKNSSCFLLTPLLLRAHLLRGQLIRTGDQAVPGADGGVDPDCDAGRVHDDDGRRLEAPLREEGGGRAHRTLIVRAVV